MTLVLVQGVLEPKLAPSVYLRPLGIVFAAEYPAAHVFALHYENPVARDDHVIDLRGASGRGYRDVVKVDVVGRFQEQLLREDTLDLTQPASEFETKGHRAPKSLGAFWLDE